MLKLKSGYGWNLWLVIFVPFFWLTDCVNQISWAVDNPADLRSPAVRVPGEFETQDAILLGASELIETNPELFLDLVRHLHGKLEIVLMVCDVEQAERAKALLRVNALPLDSVRFAGVPHNTMWTRDYGPIVVMSENMGAVLVDALYCSERMNDDETPRALAQLLGKATVELPLRIDGGNLLFNGSGLAITTDRFWNENSDSGFDETTLLETLNQAFGINRLVTLEPLFGEPTGHADMFATFVSHNTVVVGQCNSEVDPVNAEILDRNAAELARVVLSDGPLNVVRIPMPERTGETWRTYTNVIYANGVMLVPTYPDVDEPGLAEALAIYKKLFPQWRIVAVDASSVITAGGALHCISMNLAGIGRLPEFAQQHRHQSGLRR